ncbi:MAG: DUF2889 domain-containing protein [Acidimicrobiales bacterium]|nr:DUF2889 domain-containing protein [Acidimicrobiales bacterium]HRW36854.1 DUF2889 domain-containing protein [Aquihabitans sp.]
MTLQPGERARLVASLPTGPQEPVAGTPPRRPGSVRRTTAIEERWDDFGEPRRVRASGRDLVTDLDGEASVPDAASLTLLTDGTGNVTELVAEPPEPQLAEMTGVGVRSGFRAAAVALVPDHRARGSVLHQLLDDVPLAAIIATYGLTREHPEWNIPPEAAERLRDLCAGWADGATMIGTLDATEIFPIPVGPPAPSLASDDDPLAWHELPPMERRTVRRVRRLDLWRASPDELALEVYFRDSHLGPDGPEDVLHEYTVTAALDPADLRFTAVDAVAHTLPWPECPGALASAQRAVGRTVDELPEVVRLDFTGTSTCSHLNDLLRSTVAVRAMAEVLP